jgi:divalent metal cation (Fe/Co/Zn/Cd) transporter
MAAHAPARNAPPAITAALIILGLALAADGSLYLTQTAARLPSLLPGHQAGSGHHHAKHGREDLNVRAVLLDTAADAAAAAGVAASSAVIVAAGGWYWLDPAVALVIAVIITYHACVLARKITAAIRSSPAKPRRKTPSLS